jgi:hypothetical protein
MFIRILKNYLPNIDAYLDYQKILNYKTLCFKSQNLELDYQEQLFEQSKQYEYIKIIFYCIYLILNLIFNKNSI